MGSRLEGRSGDGSFALSAGRCRGRGTLRRRAAPGGAVPASVGAAGAFAARRAHQSSRRRVGDVARGASAQLSGRHPHRHPRPLLPRPRHQLDSRARPRPRHPLRGQLLGVAGAEAESGSSRKAARTRPTSAPSRASRNGSPLRRARGRPSRRRATSATRSCWRRPARSRPRPRRSSSRSPNGSGRTSSPSTICARVLAAIS